MVANITLKKNNGSGGGGDTPKSRRDFLGRIQWQPLLHYVLLWLFVRFMCLMFFVVICNACECV